MKTYQVHPLAAAIILSLLFMGAMGLFVLLPVACIQWAWNSVIVTFYLLPPIGIWQALLLYLAVATVLYLTGIISIDLRQESSAD